MNDIKRTYDYDVKLGIFQLARHALELESMALHLLGSVTRLLGELVIVLDGDGADIDADNTLDMRGDGTRSEACVVMSVTMNI